MSLRLFCDENISSAIVASLKERGFNIVKAEQGASDTEIAEKAKRERRILITFDADFSNILAYPPQKFYGIIRINIHPPFFNVVNNALMTVLEKFTSTKDFRGKLVIVDAASFRVWEEKDLPR